MDLKGKSKISLVAPAKVNLRLKVLGRRLDGYHDIEMIMVPLSLADQIEVEIISKGIKIRSESAEIPCDHSNSLWKAVEGLQSESGKDFGCRMTLHKKIPIAAGLGGGSSDAASLLKGLNQYLKLGISPTRLHDLATKIGADVPFFLTQGPQSAEGIGEKLTPLRHLPPLYLILINPKFPVSTPEVYGWYDQEGDGKNSLSTRLTRNKLNDSSTGLSRGLARWLKNFPLENDLEKVVLPRYPVLVQMKAMLSEAGALGTLMSGSGPTVFGLFETSESRDQGYDRLLRKKDPNWWVCKAESLS